MGAGLGPHSISWGFILKVFLFGAGAARAPYRWMLVVAAAAAVSLSGCAKSAEVAAAKTEPVKIDKVEGTDLSRLTLEARAVERLGLTTQTVAELSRFGDQSPRLTVPYGAVLYDAKGATWVYTNPEPLVFVRHAITVDYIKGDLAVLLEGPPVGTSVVTAGGAELAGVEFGVGK